MTVSSIPYLLGLIKADVEEVKKAYPLAPLDNCVNQFTRCLTDYAGTDEDNDSKLFRQAALEMLHQYFEWLKCGNLKKANQTINAFVCDNPVPSENLRRTLFWSGGDGVSTSCVSFPPLPLMILYHPVFVEFFIWSLAAGLGLLLPANSLAESVEASIQRDFEKNVVAKSFWAISSAVGSFFKQSEVREEPISCCSTIEISPDSVG